MSEFSEARKAQRWESLGAVAVLTAFLLAVGVGAPLLYVGAQEEKRFDAYTLARDMQFFMEPRTGLCFAETHRMMSAVACGSVMGALSAGPAARITPAQLEMAGSAIKPIALTGARAVR